jgi:hypothetical protein
MIGSRRSADGRYLEATREVLREHGALWFYDEAT